MKKKEKRPKYCRLSNHSPHITWISRNAQSFKKYQYCLICFTTRMYLALGYFFLAL